MICTELVYLHITLVKCITVHNLIFRHLALVLNTHPNPLRHGVGQLLEEGRRQVRHPHHLDGLDEEGQGTDVEVPLQLGLHDAPDVFDGVQVW